MCKNNKEMECCNSKIFNNAMRSTKVDDGTTKRKHKVDRIIEVNVESVESIAEEMKKELIQQ